MNILYAADDKFSRMLGVSIYSLLKQHQGKEVNVFVLDSDVTENNKKIINQLFNNKKHQIFWLTAKFDLSSDVSADRGSIAQFTRLFFDQILPEKVSRVLYLDCDTFIVNDLSSLYGTELNGKVGMLAEDPFSAPYRNLLHLPREAKMYNSGVMLLDRYKYEQDNYDQKIRSVINAYGRKIIQGDQGILDIVFQDNVKVMGPRYNLISSYYEFSYSELKKYRHMINFYSKDEIQASKKAPAVIHFTSDFLNTRPWLAGSQHPYVEQWRTVEKKVWGNNVFLSANSRLGKVFKALPRQMALQVFGFLQGYVRPLWYRLK